MTRDRHNNLNNPSDQEYIKQQVKAIKREKQAGNEQRAQRIATNLFQYLGWENDDGF